MAEIKTHAIVLRVRNLREADKLVTLLTKEEGKIPVVARGVRKLNSKFRALIEPVTLGYFLLHRGKSLDTLIQGEIVKPYRKLQADLIAFSTAQYFCELCESSLPEREPAVQVFELLLAALEELERDNQSSRVARCFELSLLEVLGYRPVVECCMNCGSQSGPFIFIPAQGGVACIKCTEPGIGFPLSGAALSTMKYFMETGFYRLSVCSLPANVDAEIRRANVALLMRATGRGQFKALQVILGLEGF